MLNRTVYSLLEEAAAKHGGAVALHQPVLEGAKRNYRTWTWTQYRDAVREIACGLRAMGIQSGDIVAIGSETRAEFYLADIGIMSCGAASAAMYVATPLAEQVESLSRCRAVAVFVETPKMLEAMRAAAPELTCQWILLTGAAEGATTLDDLRARGRSAADSEPGYFERICATVKRFDRAILYLTSGATGDPKMVEVSHAALVDNVDMGPAVVSLTPQDSALAFLPSAHIAQRVVLEFLMLRMGVPVWFSESLGRMPHEFKSIRPTFFLAPPRVWERIYSSVKTEIQKRGGVAKKLFYFGLGLGAHAAALRQGGKEPPFWMRQSLSFFNSVVFSKVRDRLGGRIRIAISGAAPLSKDLGLFYEAIGLPLAEGYGLTEGGVVCLNPLQNRRLGSIGKPLPGVTMKLAEDGELLIASPTLASGYFEDPRATAEVFRDGWLHTGDVAEISEDGYVSITGRKKEMIVASNGKKIYPSRIEALFKTEPLVSQLVVAGDYQPYISALITVNPAAADGMNSDAIHKSVKQAVDIANKQLAPFEQIRKFKILPADFTIEGGELTPTMKVRRSRVLAKYADAVSEMYVSREDAI